MTDRYIYIYCLHMLLELKTASVQSKMEDLELEVVVGTLGFAGFISLRHVVAM